ncbi:MAG: DUF3796 domain-containing protein [Dehalobacterium sp.]
MKNSLRHLGWLGLLGAIGFFIDNKGFYGFFGFFAFFAYARVIPDELFKMNVNKAGKNAFLTGLVFYPITAVFASFAGFVPFTTVYAFAFGINFALQVVVFSISLVVYELKGDRRWS